MKSDAKDKKGAEKSDSKDKKAPVKSDAKDKKGAEKSDSKDKKAPVKSDAKDKKASEKTDTKSKKAADQTKSPAQSRKRSFLAKIKEAVAYGSSDSDQGPEEIAESDEASALPAERLDQLTRSAQRILDASGAQTKISLENEGQSQIEILANVVDVLLSANLALLKKTKDLEAEATSIKRAEKNRSQHDDRSERDSRPDFPKTVDEIDDYDPFAYWDSIQDDDEFEEPVVKKAAASEPQKKSKQNGSLTTETPSLEKSKRGSQSQRDFDDFDDDDDFDDFDAYDDFDDYVSSAETPRKFGDLNLKGPTLRALQAMGYSAPTPIQAGAIPMIQKGVDVMGQARTGTGKTAAFMIPIVEGAADCEPGRDPLALAVLPTRELAVQVRDEAQRIARYYDLSVTACYGGKPLASQVEKLRQGVDILVGTPGRIIDLANRGALRLSSARWVVLDEADRMLDIGFRPDVEKILSLTPRDRQTLLFSATLPPDVVSLAKSYMHDPKQFDFSQDVVASDTIEQYYLTVDKSRKLEALVRLLKDQKPHQTIVFCRTKRSVDSVAARLPRRLPGNTPLTVEAIHGDYPQTRRDRIMRDFRAEKTKVLIATDVVGRGIDVSTVSHIVNYDVPQSCDDYVHRVGRAGRMGREGVAFTFVTAEEGAELTRIEMRINRLLERYEIPGFKALMRPRERAEKAPEPKQVFGRPVRRLRRAL